MLATYVCRGRQLGSRWRKLNNGGDMRRRRWAVRLRRRKRDTAAHPPVFGFQSASCPSFPKWIRSGLFSHVDFVTLPLATLPSSPPGSIQHPWGKRASLFLGPPTPQTCCYDHRGTEDRLLNVCTCFILKLNFTLLPSYASVLLYVNVLSILVRVHCVS